ncbi:MAG TPA: ABC transporter permease [Candidatus Bathyarchaeia archaeon]|nr:ABC transporter permease [Candidatus Bathyarchaeia archaeon]
MRWYHIMSLRFRSLFRKRQADRELDDELQFHLQSQIDENLAKGSSPQAAYYAALRSVGPVTQIKEECRDMRRVNFFDNFLQDLRFGFRMLVRNPAFSLMAILCLTLGIGANAAVFSWIEGLLLRPFPAVTHQDRLVVIAGINRAAGDKAAATTDYDDVSWPDFLDFRGNTRLFDAFIADKIMGTTISIGDRAERVAGSVVSANYFDALGVHPFLGRGFEPSDDSGRNAHPVTVISYWMWKERFHGDPAIIGKTQILNGVQHTIIGVAPEGFYGTFVGWPIQFWVPVSMQEVFEPGGYKLEDRSQRWIEGYARLKDGVTLAQAQAEISTVAGQLAAQYPTTNRGYDIKLLPLWKAPFNGATEMLPVLTVTLAVVFVVLLIACSNVSNLLMVRSFARQREMTIRMAVGARQGRLLQQLLTEGLILSILAVIGGLAVAYWCRNLLVVFFPAPSGIVANLKGEIDWRVLLFSAGVCLVSTLMFALVPAIQAGKVDLAGSLKSESGSVFGARGKSRIRSILVVVQVSLCFVLLVTAVLLVQSMQRIRTSDPGFLTQSLLTTGFDLVAAGYDDTRAKDFQTRLLDRVRGLSGVESASLARVRPFSYATYSSGSISVEGYQPRPDERPVVDYNQIGPDYFRTMGIPLLSGREFTDADNETAPLVAIVNEKMVKQYWRGEDPIGQRFQLKDKWLRVVGVAEVSKYSSFDEAPKPFFYVPLRQDFSIRTNLNIRTAQDPTVIAADLARLIHEIDPSLAPTEVITMRQHINRSALRSQQIMVALLGIFGGLALLLAAVGLYGVMSYAVSQSTREMGLRMALGARPAHLLKLVLSHGLFLTAIGVALGIVGALLLTRLFAALLYKVSPHDPLAFGLAFLVLTTASFAACFFPAWKATRTDPVRALRD